MRICPNIFNLIFLASLNIIIQTCCGQNVTQVQFKQVDNRVVITYYLDQKADIKVSISTNGGQTFRPIHKVLGDVGKNVHPGYKTIYWNTLEEVDEIRSNQVVFKVHADKPHNQLCYDCRNIRRKLYMGVVAGDMNGLSLCANTRVPLSVLIEVGISPIHWALDLNHGFVYYPSLSNTFSDDYMPCFAGVNVSILGKPHSKRIMNGWYFLFGGGPKLGYLFFIEQREIEYPDAVPGAFALGVSGLVGMEYKFAKPLTLQFDMRFFYTVCVSSPYTILFSLVPSISLKYHIR